MADGFVAIRYRVLVITFLGIAKAADTIRCSKVWLEANGFAAIRDGVSMVAFPHMSYTAVVVPKGIVGIKADGFVAIRDGVLVIAFLGIGMAAVAIRYRVGSLETAGLPRSYNGADNARTAANCEVSILILTAVANRIGKRCTG